MAWNCSGTKLASGSVDQTARIWHIEPHGHVSFLTSFFFVFIQLYKLQKSLLYVIVAFFANLLWLWTVLLVLGPDFIIHKLKCEAGCVKTGKLQMNLGEREHLNQLR